MGELKATLTKKWHGIPVWALALGTAIFLYFGYKWYKNRQANTSSETNSSLIAPAADTSGQTAPGVPAGGSLSIPDSSTPSVTGAYDPGAFADLLAQDLAQALQSANPAQATTTTDATNIQGTTFAQPITSSEVAPPQKFGGVKSPQIPSASSLQLPTNGQKINAPVVTDVITAQTKLPSTSKLTKVLPSGAKIYTTSTGAKIEKAPGKSPYRIAK